MRLMRCHVSRDLRSHGRERRRDAEDVTALQLTDKTHGGVKIENSRRFSHHEKGPLREALQRLTRQKNFFTTGLPARRGH